MNQKVSRRSLLKGAALTMAALSPVEAQTPSAPAGTDRIAEFEKLRGVPLTPEQKKFLPGQLKDLEETGAGLRHFVLQDGGSEPAAVFHPLVR